jgi:hypothetical protein
MVLTLIRNGGPGHLDSCGVLGACGRCIPGYVLVQVRRRGFADGNERSIFAALRDSNLQKYQGKIRAHPQQQPRETLQDNGTQTPASERLGSNMTGSPNGSSSSSACHLWCASAC